MQENLLRCASSCILCIFIIRLTKTETYHHLSENNGSVQMTSENNNKKEVKWNFLEIYNFIKENHEPVALVFQSNM